MWNNKKFISSNASYFYVYIKFSIKCLIYNKSNKKRNPVSTHKIYINVKYPINDNFICLNQMYLVSTYKIYHMVNRLWSFLSPSTQVIWVTWVPQVTRVLKVTRVTQFILVIQVMRCVNKSNKSDLVLLYKKLIQVIQIIRIIQVIRVIMLSWHSVNLSLIFQHYYRLTDEQTTLGVTGLFRRQIYIENSIKCNHTRT